MTLDGDDDDNYDDTDNANDDDDNDDDDDDDDNGGGIGGGNDDVDAGDDCEVFSEQKQHSHFLLKILMFRIIYRNAITNTRSFYANAPQNGKYNLNSIRYLPLRTMLFAYSLRFNFIPQMMGHRLTIPISVPNISRGR